MMMRGRYTHLAGAAVALVLSGTLLGCAAPPQTHEVAIDGLKYSSESLTVKTGDSIVWTNKDPFPHTVTSPAGGFDSKAIAPGQTWKYTASKTGSFAYTCTFHPVMKGTLIVN